MSVKGNTVNLAAVGLEPRALHDRVAEAGNRTGCEPAPFTPMGLEIEEPTP